ncbi:hypothetical protein B7494_g4787 [Chlorociboria aeruginascens]|nr:hypothetical protein B7494_g4787 [Chlorociboria aeruginascens]
MTRPEYATGGDEKKLEGRLIHFIETLKDMRKEVEFYRRFPVNYDSKLVNCFAGAALPTIFFYGVRGVRGIRELITWFLPRVNCLSITTFPSPPVPNHTQMPLDTSTYSLALLRLDGRRWNELRRINAQISTQASADGSSYFEMGNTKVICTVTGPSEQKVQGGQRGGSDKADIRVEISMAGFSGVERKRRGRGDKRIAELNATLVQTFSRTLSTHLYPHSTILISLHILAHDGSLLATLLNASTLALIDAGIPMSAYLTACTSGSTSSYSSTEENADPLLDLNGLEEQELPFLTVATVGGGDEVVVLVMESRVRVERVEGMLAVGVDGCKQVREILDGVVREKGSRVLEGLKG